MSYRDVHSTPRRIVLALVGLLMMSAFTAPVAMASYHPGQGGDGSMGNEPSGQDKSTAHKNGSMMGANRTQAQEHRTSAQAHANTWQMMAADKRQAAQERASAARMFSLLDYQDGVGDGRFVSFVLDEQTGTFTDYTVQDDDRSVTLFSSVSFEPFTVDRDARVGGAVLHLFAENLTVGVHDTPNAQFRVVAGQAVNVTFELGSSLTHNPAGPGMRYDHDSGVHFHFVAADGTELTGENGTVTAGVPANGTLVVMAHPVTSGVRTANLHERIDAIATGRLGGEISVVDVDGTPATEAAEFGLQMRATKTNGTGVELEVEGNATEAKAVVVNVDQASLGNGTPEQIVVTLDGERVPVVDSAADVLAGANSGTARAALVAANGAVQVTVNIPTFSLHVLTVYQTMVDDDTTDDDTTDGGDGTTDGDDTTGDDDPASGDDEDAATPGPGVLAALLVASLAALVTGRHTRRD